MVTATQTPKAKKARSPIKKRVSGISTVLARFASENIENGSPTKTVCVQRLEELKKSMRYSDTLTTTQAGVVIGRTRQWIHIHRDALKAKVDSTKGKKKTYYVVTLQDLEKFIEFKMFPRVA